VVSLVREEEACVRMLMGQHLQAVAVNSYIHYTYIIALIIEAWTRPSSGQRLHPLVSGPGALTGSREVSATISFPFKGRGGVIISNFVFGLVSTVMCLSAY